MVCKTIPLAEIISFYVRFAGCYMPPTTRLTTLYFVSAPLMGMVLTFSFAPFDHAWLGFVAMLFLFAGWRGLKPLKAAGVGFLFGLGWFGSGVSWVFVSVYDHGGENLWVSLSVTFLFVALWSVFPALAGAVYRALSQRLGDSVFLAPGVWLAVEGLRGQIVLNGFPWLLLGYGQIDTPLAGWAPILGVYGLTFLVALIANCLVLMFSRPENRALYACTVLLLTGIGVIGEKLTWTEANGYLPVTVVQGNFDQKDKWRPEHRAATLARYHRLTNAYWQPLVVWPETSVPAFYREVKDSFIKQLETQALARQAVVLISLPMKEQQSGNRFNTAMTVGEQRRVYRKEHLLPFGEYLPMPELLGPMVDALDLPLGRFSPGADDQPLLTVKQHPFITTICYEDVFPAEKRELAQARFLVNITNDAWFGRSLEIHQHFQIARMRALESGRYLVRAANTGRSGIIDHKGRVRYSIPAFTENAVTGQVGLRSGLTPFSRMGDTGVIGLLLAACVLTIAADYRLRR